MINQSFSMRLRGAGIAGLLLLAGLGFTYPVSGVAGSMDATSSSSAAAVETIVGTVDGLDLKKQRIWINDRRYLISRSTKVKGTSTKIGLITDLKQGETVKAEIQPNEDGSSPYVTTIYRQ